MRIESGARSHSDPLGETRLRRSNAKLHRFRCARRHLDHHFLLISCIDLWRNVNRAKRGHAREMSGVRHHRHRDSVLARRHSVRDYERPNHIRFDLQFFNIRFDTSRQHRLGHIAHHSHWTVWNVFR